MTSQLDSGVDPTAAGAGARDEVVRDLLVRTNLRSLLQFGVQYSVLLGSAVFLALGWGRPWWQLAPCVLVFGVLLVAMYSAIHETIHRTAFRTPWLNDVVLWLACAAFPYTPTGHKYFHFAHHRHTSDPLKDPELAVGRPTDSTFTYLLWVSGLPLLFYKVAVVACAAAGFPAGFVWRRFLYYVPKEKRLQIRLESWLLLALHAGLLYLAATRWPGIFLVYAGQFVGSVGQAVYIIADHNGLAREGTVYDRTRSLRSGWLMRFLVWNGPYHAEHHAYPGVPWHALPRLHHLLEPKLEHRTAGYPAFHRQVVRALAEGYPFRETTAGS